MLPPLFRQHRQNHHRTDGFAFRRDRRGRRSLHGLEKFFGAALRTPARGVPTGAAMAINAAMLLSWTSVPVVPRLRTEILPCRGGNLPPQMSDVLRSCRRLIAAPTGLYVYPRRGELRSPDFQYQIQLTNWISHQLFIIHNSSFISSLPSAYTLKVRFCPQVTND